jgi:hypothetical protein
MATASSIGNEKPIGATNPSIATVAAEIDDARTP